MMFQTYPRRIERWKREVMSRQKSDKLSSRPHDAAQCKILQQNDEKEPIQSCDRDDQVEKSA